ncbi:hypothetical protein Sango_1118400 [Sesamum angolense]|uniref:B box-type domain-containing protein n=1 Tax=Sesamum angolense TaxID=2727404 RepID=A0AAE1WVP1_9LAMI|nr:hypothetical protein Sango_1118400 [Sesamum angolense]
MVGCKIRLRKRKQAEWVSGLLRSKFFGSCVDHGELRKNERNLFCIDCNLCFCKHCVTSAAHDCLHRLLQICKYVYHDVVRLHDIQKHLDCSLIQAYKINGEKAVHLNPRPQLKDTKSSKAKGGGTSCEACGRHIQDLPNRFCSIACKVSIDTEITINQSNRIISAPMSKVGHLPNLEPEENSYEIGYTSSSPSLTESSSEVIQAWSSPVLRPKKMLNKRKSVPRRAPMC